jgi:hypothetical protein
LNPPPRIAVRKPRRMNRYKHNKYFSLMMNDWKDRLGVVYSTSADFDYQTNEAEEPETLAPAAQVLRVRIEKKGRGGKTATLVSGFVGTSADLADLGRTLKSKCGVGGSVKDGEILVQGDFRERVISLLRSMGYTGTK